MNEHFQSNSTSEVPLQSEPDAMVLLKKIQQQLVFLEKKVDLLVSQSSERPSRERNFSRPFRPAGNSHRYENRGPSHGSRDRNFSQGSPQSRPFDQAPGGPNRGFGQRKKPLFKHRKDRG